MADIFVIYAKTDQPLASKLVAMREAEGWKVWWDTSLGAADLYRDEIMKQLASARAVITIWTPNSIRSDWVRAEAGTAKKEGKLIPVKTPDVTYADIPMPFGEMHTENLGSSELISAAVVAQLAKPTVELTAVALLTKGFKYELLTWVGIVGGALMLFTNLSAVLKLADWARRFLFNIGRSGHMGFGCGHLVGWGCIYRRNGRQCYLFLYSGHSALLAKASNSTGQLAPRQKAICILKGRFHHGGYGAFFVPICASTSQCLY
jgi:hypothetical protein